MWKSGSVIPLLFSLGVIASAQDRPHVLITDSRSWETAGQAEFSGRARPRTVKTTETFQESCREVIVTSDKSKADFVVLLDREDANVVIVEVLDKSGKAFHSSSAKSIPDAETQACRVISARLSRKKDK
jgi:hypothetical protein